MMLSLDIGTKLQLNVRRKMLLSETILDLILQECLDFRGSFALYRRKFQPSNFKTRSVACVG